MSMKYRRLTEFLANRPDTSEWTASFQKIEKILGFPLPESAYAYQAWWSNQMRSQSLAWQTAGYKTADLDLKNQKVTFVYVSDEEHSDEPETGRVTARRSIPELTIAEAKAGLAAKFGVDESQIEILIKA